MIKRIAVLLSFIVVLSVAAVPAYAQTTSSSNDQGLFGKFTHFFGKLFHPGNGGQTQATEDSTTPGEPNPSMNPMPSGKPDQLTMAKYKLTLLVKQGKITQTQADAILAELSKVQSELKTWAASQGINEAYVLGIMDPGMSGVNNMMRQGGQGDQGSQNQGQGQHGSTNQGMMRGGQQQTQGQY